MLTLGVVSALALILGAVGLYGVLAYVVAERTREIGVRMALGATAGAVRRLVVSQGAKVVLIGTVVGVVAALASTRLLEALLYDVDAVDPLVFAAMSVDDDRHRHAGELRARAPREPRGSDRVAADRLAKARGTRSYNPPNAAASRHVAASSSPPARRARRRRMSAGVGGNLSGRPGRRRGACRSGGGGARPRKHAGRILRRHPHQPLPPGVDCDARAAGAERVALGQLRSRPARAGQRRLGLCREQPRRSVVRPRRRRAGRRHRARQRRAGHAQGRSRSGRDGRDVLDERVQARPVRGAARHQDRVPHARSTRPRWQWPASRSSARRFFSSTSRSPSRRARGRASRSGWCAPIRSSRPRPPIGRAATSRPAPSVDRAQLVGYEYVEDYPWLADAERAGHEVVEKLKSPPVAAGRYDLVVDPSQLFLTIHESVGHSTELDRALGWEANMAGTSFVKPGRRRQAALRRERSSTSSPIARSPAASPPPADDDEGVKAERWHLVRDGMFVDWQTTRELAPLVGQPRSHGCLHADDWASVPFPRMPNVSLEPAATEVTLDDARSATSSAGCSSRAAASSSIDQQRYNFQFGGAVIPRDTQRQARGDGQGRRLSVAHARFLGVVRRRRRSGDAIACGGRSADGKGEPGQTNAVSHGCPPARFRQVTVLNTAALVRRRDADADS